MGMGLAPKAAKSFNALKHKNTRQSTIPEPLAKVYDAWHIPVYSQRLVPTQSEWSIALLIQV